MSTVPLEELDQERIKNHLKALLQADTISDFIVHPSAVNTTLQFEANKKQYVMKLMTTPATSEWEEYRFDKVAKLLGELYPNPAIPTPKIIHVEDTIELLGYRFIIISFVEGENLWSLWQNLSQEEITPIVKELATIVRAIHSIEYDFYGELEECESSARYTNYKEKLIAQLDEYTSKLIERETLPKELVQKAESFVMENMDKMKIPKKSTLLHNDIHQGNMIVKKDSHGIYKIQAILDWEWSCADNPIEDIIYIEEGLLQDSKVRKVFYDEYFQGKYENLSDFAIDIKIFNILWKLDDFVCGWTFHNPTPENLETAQKDLEEFLDS